MSVTDEAESFKAISGLASKLTERRNSERLPYQAKAMVAYYEREEVPPMDAFGAVECVDVSRGGFSFYSATSPQHKATARGSNG